jgi:hypothetical protein
MSTETDGARKSAVTAGGGHSPFVSVMPEQRQQNDDRDRNPDQPQQCATPKAHDNLLSHVFGRNTRRENWFHNGSNYADPAGYSTQ